MDWGEIVFMVCMGLLASGMVILPILLVSNSLPKTYGECYDRCISTDAGGKLDTRYNECIVESEEPRTCKARIDERVKVYCEDDCSDRFDKSTERDGVEYKG